MNHLNYSATPPDAKQVEHTHNEHKVPRQDPYFWMRERDSKDVVSYLNAENEYTDKVLQPVKDEVKEIFEEMKGRLEKNEESVPYKKGNFFYYIRYEDKKDYPIICRKLNNLEAAEQILLDVNEMAKGQDYYQVSTYKVSPDGKTLAFAVDTKGRRFYNIYFKDLSTGKILDKKIEDVTPNITWDMDNNTLYYAQQDPVTLRSDRVYSFNVQSGESQLQYQEKDELYSVYVSRSFDDSYIMLDIGSTETSEVRYRKVSDLKGDWQMFSPRQQGVEYGVESAEDLFYVSTNKDDAKNFKVMTVTPENTKSSQWVELIPHNDEVFIEGISVFKNFLVLQERFNGLTRLRLQDRKTQEFQEVTFPDQAYVVYESTNAEYDTDRFRYAYQSPVRPQTVYEYNPTDQKSTLLKQSKVLGGFNPDNYVVERISVSSHDGALVPVTLVYHKSFKKDGSHPGLVYGYGSYGISSEPSFNSTNLSLLDRGFVHATAHIRGGSELGRNWYENGKYLKKKNSFLDFIAVSEALIKQRYVAADNLFAMGGSAGGLLMGAVINMRPDLYKGVIAAVPFVDVVTTMLNDSLPLTVGEYEEWGNPNNKEYFDYMLSYSPYDNIKKQAYPNIWVASGYHDSQVQYWEPTKWVARLRDNNTSDNLIILQTEMDAGHGGTTGRFKSLEERARMYAFLIELSKKKPEVKTPQS